MVRDIEDDDGVLIFDDTIQEKPYTDENELIAWHFDHSKNRAVKGINLLNCVYHAQGVTLPVACELISKPLTYRDAKTGRLKRKSTCSKNEHLRRMLSVCQRNQVAYRYVLADSWFSAKENLHFIRHGLGKHFVIALKSNRTVALSHEAKRQGTFSTPRRAEPAGTPSGARLLERTGLSSSCRAPSLYKQKMAAPVFCIWLAATSRVMEKAWSQSTRNGGTWRPFTRRSRVMRRSPNRRPARYEPRAIIVFWRSTPRAA